MKCIGVDECNINFSGEDSYDLDHDKLSYYWNFGNGTTSDKENPAAMKFGVGEYAVILCVTDAKGFSAEDTFRISVLGKKKKEIIPTKSLDPNVFFLKLTGVNPNPTGDDTMLEWVEITNPLGTNVSLALCSIDDDIGKGSDPYEFSEDAVILANSKNRYYRPQTRLNFNNTGDSANFVCAGRVVSMIAWNYSVPEDFIVTGENNPRKEPTGKKVVRATQGNTLVTILPDKQEKIPFELIGISLQGALSKNRKLTGNIFTCHTKLSCSVNFTAGKTRKDTVYFWDFGNGRTFYGANPVSHTFSLGKYTVRLKIFDTKTMNIREESFIVIIKKLVTVKKLKKAKTALAKTENPLMVKGQDFFSPPPLIFPEFSPLQAATSAGVIALVFFSGMYGMLRRKGIITL